MSVVTLRIPVMLMLLVGALHTAAFAQDVNTLTTFSNGAKTNADEVNTNFTTLKDAVNSKQDKLIGACAAGSFINQVNADGSLVCDTPAGGGDITGVAAGNGLSGGGASGDVTLTVNTNVVQQRLSAPCAAGSSIRDISAAGVPTCEPDDVGGARGVTFTRWGHNTCPTGTSMVYNGFAASSAHNHGGSGVTQLCLVATPTWDNFSDVNQDGALIYGTEYQTSGYGLASVSPFNTLHDFNAPCAVCLDASADMQLMVPGTNICPSGWNTRVQGYLMSTHYTQAKSEFSCIDRGAIAVGTAANEDGNLWYPTEAECGSLPCGPGQYVQNRELTCSICTR